MRPADLERLRIDAPPGPWHVVLAGEAAHVETFKGVRVCTTTPASAELLAAAPDMVAYIVDDKSGYGDALSLRTTEVADVKTAVGEGVDATDEVIAELEALAGSEMILADKLRDILVALHEKTTADDRGEEEAAEAEAALAPAVLRAELTAAIVLLDDMTAHTEGVSEQAATLKYICKTIWSA